MNTRNDFPALLKSMELFGEACEVGVAEGWNSFHILNNWPGKLTMIDPWAILDTPGFSGHGEATNAEQEARYQRMLKQAQRYGGRCIVKRATSEQAAKDYPDGFFVFCYIDSIHTYESSAQDLALWWPKVRNGGILAGHDHLEGFYNGQDYGVKRAVAEFARAHSLTIGVTQETDWPSFWLVRP